MRPLTDLIFLFFQRFLGEYKKYAWPKTLTTTCRNSRVFKVTKLHNCLKLRYMTFRCQNCSHYFTAFNTTKPVHEWKDEKLPQISKKLLENEGIILCSDCIYMTDVIPRNNWYQLFQKCFNPHHCEYKKCACIYLAKQFFAHAVFNSPHFAIVELKSLRLRKPTE